MKPPIETVVPDFRQRPAGVRIWSRCEYHFLQLLTSGPLLPTKKQLCRPALRGPFSTTAARKAISNLCQRRWIERYRIAVCGPQPPDEPLLICHPGDDCPNFRRLKAKLKRQRESTIRWRTLRVYLPSRQAAGLFGAPYLAIETHKTHGYRTAISHAVSRLHAPATLDWIWDTQRTSRLYEHVIGLCITIDNRPPRVIGITSEQSCRSLQELHAHALTQRLPIELW